MWLLCLKIHVFRRHHWTQERNNQTYNQNNVNCKNDICYEMKNDTPLVIVFLNDMYFDILDLKNFIQYIYTCYGRLLGIWYLNPAFPKTEILLDVDIADKQIKIYNIFTSFIPMHTYTYLFCCIRHCVYYDRVIEKQFSYHSQSNNKNMNMSFFTEH